MLSKSNPSRNRATGTEKSQDRPEHTALTLQTMDEQQVKQESSDRTYHPPSTIADWKNAQDTEPDFLQLLDPDTLAHCNGLSVLKDADFPSRILVPPSLRDPLTRQHHYDLQHVSHL